MNKSYIHYFLVTPPTFLRLSISLSLNIIHKKGFLNIKQVSFYFLIIVGWKHHHHQSRQFEIFKIFPFFILFYFFIFSISSFFSDFLYFTRQRSLNLSLSIYLFFFFEQFNVSSRFVAFFLPLPLHISFSLSLSFFHFILNNASLHETHFKISFTFSLQLLK